MATPSAKRARLHAALGSCALFGGVESSSYDQVVDFLGGVVRPYEPDMLLVRMGDALGKFGIVLEGSLEIGFYDESGTLANVAHVGPGESFGESIAYAGILAPVQVKARTASSVLWIEAARILQTGAIGCPQAATPLLGNLVRLLASKNVFLNGKVHILAQKHLRDRIKLYLSHQRRGHGKSAGSSRSDLAKFLCVDRSALSRELGRLRDEGILLLDGKEIIVVDETFLDA